MTLFYKPKHSAPTPESRGAQHMARPSRPFIWPRVKPHEPVPVIAFDVGDIDPRPPRILDKLSNLLRWRKVSVAAGAMVLSASVALFPNPGTGPTADAHDNREVPMLEQCDKFPDSLGPVTPVDADTPEKRAQFYADYQAANEFVSGHRHIVGSSVDPDETLCAYTDGPREPITVVSPIATVHMWEMEGMKPDAGAELNPSPNPGESYFVLRQPDKV